MSEAARLLNPLVFHFQKLGLELKCPLCLNLLHKPVLLPCNHIFCNFCVPVPSQFSTQCPSCQQHFTHQEIRPASHLDHIIAIYKSLDSTFNSAVLPLLSTDSGNPVSVSNSVDQLRKILSETATKGQDNHTGALQINCVSSGTKCSVSEELDVNHAPEVSPGSSPSTSEDVKHPEGLESDPGSRRGGIKNQLVRKSVGDILGTEAGEMDDKDAFHTRELKRQKKLDYGLSDTVLQRHGECKSKEDKSVIPSIGPCDASNVNGNVCAFCHSSKITERSGPLLHYADGKEVSGDGTASSKAITVHSKCIDWTPKVYFVGETIKNLESELARASKLKCSSCGLKGAALGCFAKSCRRSYHVLCAVEVPDCRWDCDDFLMLCPVHNSIKFPSEKSKSRKPHTEQKCSVPSQIGKTCDDDIFGLSSHLNVRMNVATRRTSAATEQQLGFWATSPNGPQEWVFCGSALSSKDKCLLVKFATMCGATVFKFWNPNVTHVIAATDSDGAYSRTLKVLMAILNGRWILAMDWIKACLEANCYVNEEPYEVNLDNHGCCGGARAGRLRASNNAPKLFNGWSFYFNGDFVPSYKSDLLDLVRVGGGSVIESLDEIVERKCDQRSISTTFVVFCNDYPQGCVAKEASSFVFKRLAEAEDVCKDIDARVIPHTWILESIAACRVLPVPLC